MNRRNKVECNDPDEDVDPDDIKDAVDPVKIYFKEQNCLNVYRRYM